MPALPLLLLGRCSSRPSAAFVTPSFSEPIRDKSFICGNTSWKVDPGWGDPPVQWPLNTSSGAESKTAEPKESLPQAAYKSKGYCHGHKDRSQWEETILNTPVRESFLSVKDFLIFKKVLYNCYLLLIRSATSAVPIRGPINVRRNP